MPIDSIQHLNNVWVVKLLVELLVRPGHAHFTNTRHTIEHIPDTTFLQQREMFLQISSPISLLIHGHFSILEHF